jgi:hypothetical protein
VKSCKPCLEGLEDRFAPVVHSFSAATTHSDSPNAGASPTANAIVRANLGGLPAPVFASAGHAQGVPFELGSVPGR